MDMFSSKEELGWWSAPCVQSTLIHSGLCVADMTEQARSGSLQTPQTQQGLLTQAQCQVNTASLLTDQLGSAVLAWSPS